MTPHVTEGSFIHQYLQYMAKQETAVLYDFWTAVWMIGSTLGRLTVVYRPRAPIFLNWYVILVADSGVTRKSTAVRSSTTLVRDVLPKTAWLVESKTTPEALSLQMTTLSALHGHVHTVISVSELATFLGRERYNNAMPVLLTDLYDCPDRITGGGTVTGGPTLVLKPFVSFLSASTPSWLVRAVNPDVVEGGFTSRCIFVVADAPKARFAWPETDTGDTEAQHRLRVELQYLRGKAETIDRIDLNDKAKETFTNWYNSRRLHHDVYRSTFESREDAHILRLAATLAINDNCWLIMHEHIIRAIAAISHAKEQAAGIFTTWFGASRLAHLVDKIRSILLDAGLDGVKQRDILTSVVTYGKAADMVRVLSAMTRLDMAESRKVQLDRGRPLTLWRAKPKLIDQGAIETILETLEGA